MDEGNVLGISILDPEVLKATQVILVAVGITAFFLVLDLVIVIETEGLRGLSRVEVFLWIIDTAKSIFMIFSGHAGVKKSSSFLLGCFCLLSIVSCGAELTSGALDITKHARATSFMLHFFAAVFYAVAVYFSRFLWVEAREGSLHDGLKTGSDRGGYTVLGIALPNLQFLKITQRLFTSLGIIICILGSVLIISLDQVLIDAPARMAFACCFITMMSLSYSGYFGVKKSSAGLLACFSCISGVSCTFLLLVTVFAVWTCTAECMVTLVINVGVTGVFGVATSSAWYLRRMVKAGMNENTEPGGSAPRPAQFGITLDTTLDDIEGIAVSPQVPTKNTDDDNSACKA